MTFWKSVTAALGAGALYLAKEAASELKIANTIKELAKNKVFYTVTIGQHNQYVMFTELMEYLLTFFNVFGTKLNLYTFTIYNFTKKRITTINKQFL